MKRLSVRFSFVYKYFILFLAAIIAIGFTLMGIINQAWLLVPIGLALAAFFLLFRWYFFPLKYMLNLSDIFYDDKNLYINWNGGKTTYKLSEVVSVNRVYWRYELYAIETNDEYIYYFVPLGTIELQRFFYGKSPKVVTDFAEKLEQIHGLN